MAWPLLKKWGIQNHRPAPLFHMRGCVLFGWKGQKQLLTEFPADEDSRSRKVFWSCRAELMEHGMNSARVWTSCPTGAMHATNVCTHAMERCFGHTNQVAIVMRPASRRPSRQQQWVSLQHTCSESPAAFPSFLLWMRDFQTTES